MGQAVVHYFRGYYFFFDLQMCNYENNSPFLYPILPAHSAVEMHQVTPRAQLSNIASQSKNMAGAAGKRRSCYIGGLDSQAGLKRVKEEAGWLAICGHCINIYSFSVIRMAMAICLEKYIVKSSEFPPPYLGSLGRTVIDSKLFWISKKSFFLL